MKATLEHGQLFANATVFCRYALELLQLLEPEMQGLRSPNGGHSHQLMQQADMQQVSTLDARATFSAASFRA
jgi:hypothetical protein